MLRILFASVLALAFSTFQPAAAAAPATLAYQGRLADGGGQPINATLSISFRLYDVASGGSALWSETQAGIEVDGGNLAVQLGAVTPLPADVWGRQLYLGVQIAGDSEMLPRPALTAAPFALRAAGTAKHTRWVSAEGTPGENGAALLAAVAAASSASAAAPLAIELDAGHYDLGSVRLDLPSYVTLSGRGQGATTLTSSFGNGTLLLASNAHVRSLTARNTGVPATSNDFTFGIGAAVAGSVDPVDNVSLQDVTGEAIGAPGSPGARQGLYLCTTNSRVTHATGRGEGGEFTFGLRSDCGNDHDSANLAIDGLTLEASGGTMGLRGAYLAGGGVWHNVNVTLETNSTAQTAFGIRLFTSALGLEALMSELRVFILGNDLVTPTATSLIEGVRLDPGAQVGFKGAVISLDQAKATFISGVRIQGDSTLVRSSRFVDLDVTIDGLVDTSQSPGEILAVRLQGALTELQRARLRVTCLAGGTGGCSGVRRVNPPGPPTTPTTLLQAGTLLLDQVSIDVGHIDPADATASAFGYDGTGPARIVNSALRVRRSADNELHFGIRLPAAEADVRVLNSVLEVDNPGDPNAGCAIGGAAGSAELFGNHLQGNVSCGTTATVTCAGNTKRGVGFLGASCS